MSSYGTQTVAIEIVNTQGDVCTYCGRHIPKGKTAFVRIDKKTLQCESVLSLTTEGYTQRRLSQAENTNLYCSKVCDREDG